MGTKFCRGLSRHLDAGSSNKSLLSRFRFVRFLEDDDFTAQITSKVKHENAPARHARECDLALGVVKEFGPPYDLEVNHNLTISGICTIYTYLGVGRPHTQQPIGEHQSARSLHPPLSLPPSCTPEAVWTRPARA